MPKRASKRRISASDEIEQASLAIDTIKNEENYSVFEEFQEELLPTVNCSVEHLNERIINIETKLDKIIYDQSLILNMLQKLTNDTVPVTPIYFPLKNEQELQKMNLEAKKDLDKVTNLIRSITNGELIKKFNSIINETILMDYNLDGVNSKKAFKEFRSLNKAIYNAHMRNGYSEDDFLADIRAAFRMHKQRLFKRNYDKRKKLLSRTEKHDSDSDSESPTSEIQF